MGRPVSVVCGRRNCTKCGRWRHVSDFSANRRDPVTGDVRWINSYCIACERARWRETLSDPMARLRKAENLRIARRLEAEREGKTVANYKVKNPFTGNRITVSDLEKYLKRIAVTR
jgi:hypothetical protein